MPHELTPLPTQAGEDATGVNPTPAANTTLFGLGFNQLTNHQNDRPTLQHRGRALAAAQGQQQKRSGGSGNNDDYKNEGNGGGGGSLAAAHW